MIQAAGDRGRMITFEGIDGAGKSTHIDGVQTLLRARGVVTLRTREPGGTALGEALRGLLLNQPMTREAETLLMFAARADHVAQVIGPALDAGQWVLCDRFTDATYAYQAGGRGIDVQRIAELEQWVHPDLQPDLTILFDIAPEIAAQRLSQSRCADRFESEPTQFFIAVRQAYLRRAATHPARFLVVDSARESAAVSSELEEFLQQWNG